MTTPNFKSIEPAIAAAVPGVVTAHILICEWVDVVTGERYLGIAHNEGLPRWQWAGLLAGAELVYDCEDEDD